MKATLSQHNFKGDVASMHLDINIDSSELKCACANITDIDEINITISNLRKMAHRRVDTLIDTATADFLKSKLKNID